ncbi:extracellular matrix glycoprotein pherophorin-V9 [Volvox carteri f. nagariensis]|uniref:Pherophorin n=1 Tax=Volvox carteri f. nagariensis TaxID=3068 RepID=Q852P0_VOLCA|nr:extracellular matrix glycoprotein pherophorin-V9 [Volvox carteri f. nagariensis]EFJ45689.1 extracellular matrix glycoprotein pherophorin-V9 [Volvox carteri f. nagariensis]BAC57890.1 pherophorin [Volvox carteri f. nagariensis]|eukprot:XP_002953379.1 extracellular matrix glycoprotein pherophorin-V9 [Volvox carteri f. nagariensis]
MEKRIIHFLFLSTLAVGWAIGADAQEYDYDPSRVQTGTTPDFPYRKCNTTNGPYRLNPVWRFVANRIYCFTIQVKLDPLSCSGPCCNADLHKIEFNVSSSCLVAGASVIASVNGRKTMIAPAFDRPATGPPGSAVLRITNLGLTTETAQNAELCLVLRTNRGGQGCTTLQQLCTSAGLPAGTCTVATYDAACDCCPQNIVVEPQPPPPPPPPPPPSPPPPPPPPPPPSPPPPPPPPPPPSPPPPPPPPPPPSPPPPPPPPSPSPPPPPPSPSPPPPPPPPSPPPAPPPFVPGFFDCELCFAAELTPPTDSAPYRFDNATCTAFQTAVSEDMNSILQNFNVTIKSPYPNSTSCTGTQAIVCGKFLKGDLALLEQTVRSEIYQKVVKWLAIITGEGECKPQLSGYEVTVKTLPGASPACIDVEAAVLCLIYDPPPPPPPLPPLPFPNCTCNTTQNIMPYKLSPTWYTTNSSRSYASEYCFTLSVLPPELVVPSTCMSKNDTLAKLEWYIDERMRPAVKGFTLYPAVGPSRTVSPSWGATGVQTLKVNLNWNATMANGGKVCIAVAKPYRLEDLCLGPRGTASIGKCYASIFNRDSSDYCCPTYLTSPQ